MTFLRIKTIKNKKYLYRQTSVRKGKKVKSIMQYVCSLGWIGVASVSPGYIGSRGHASTDIPPKSNRNDPVCFSPYLYRARNRVERFFNRIKQCRRIATRYDRLAANYLAFVQLASIRLWLRVNESRPRQLPDIASDENAVIRELQHACC